MERLHVREALQDPLAELAAVDLPAGAQFVLQPRRLVGVVQDRDHPIRITSHWRFGLGAWIAAFVLTIWDTELARTLTAALGLAALAFAAYLVILQLFVIDAICVWCMANDVVLIPVFAVLALLRLRTAEAEPSG